MKQHLLFLLPILLLGCATTTPPPPQAPIAMEGSSGTTCHLSENNLRSAMVSCRFHNETNRDIATCAQITFVSTVENQVEYRSEPMCSGILAPNETSENADLVNELARKHLSHACGREMSHCSLHIEPVRSP